MSKIVSISTQTPPFLHSQQKLFDFADAVYSKNETDSRKLKFLYRKSGIEQRYSVIEDYCLPADKRYFYSDRADLEPFPSLEKRMKVYAQYATPLSVKAITDCIKNKITPAAITHLITVSCTGMSAPGLDLKIMEAMDLSPNLIRTSVNFMGCYAAIHGLKLADAFCSRHPDANVIVVCTEFCTLHFQKENTPDNIMSGLLFSDGCAAMLIQGSSPHKGMQLKHFYSQVSFKGKNEMSWELSGKGFLMTLTGYVPDLIKADFEKLVSGAMEAAGLSKKDITHWCIHPGGKKILEVIESSLSLAADELKYAYEVLKQYGNMSSASIVFVLKHILTELEKQDPAHANILGAAFGPGLTMETFIASYA